MKLLIAADTYHPQVNGAATFTQCLASSLNRRGHQVLIVAPSRKLYNEVYIHDGIQVLGIRSMPLFIYKDLRISPRMLQGGTLDNAFKTYAPEVVHVQGHFFICKAAVKTARAIGLPTVGTNHFMPENLSHYLHLPAFIVEWLHRWGWKQFRAVFEGIDIVTTPTKTAAKLLQQIGLRKEVLPISNGIDRSRFRPSSNRAQLRRENGLPADKKILLYVGRLDKEKNIDLVLLGFSRVVHTIDLHLVIAGIGAEERRLKRLMLALGLKEHVTFKGFVPDDTLPGLYATADCFIIAGTAELQSIVTMEAMASGLPVIGARAIALPELVQPGINGCLFDPGDEAGVADCIATVFSNDSLRKEFSNGSLMIIERHDIEQTVIRFETIYRDLATGGRPATNPLRHEAAKPSQL